ncbi:hypothetical protein M0811_00142 [Anaeramoeba ignava]|uniref:serine C-palmitoyltransferase n=1 Tax=Anaeramoeba ignava TaxID=1746090 RepID=A0A9Q0RE65_ANAIG|nr:hypothetical protein M0811_00142 [Anaeramoeba ignava]|eukprot:Anaeramoba_ignava/a347891_97.p1 GENE.a347891_97~~a347891_97.p1  ORF type:complete len:519 (-),score=81.09 a347891_97:110-1645(-)
MTKYPITFFNIVTVYMTYGVMIIFGYLEDLFEKVCASFFSVLGLVKSGKKRKILAPLTDSFQAFYVRKVYGRVHDILNRPISSSPAAWIDVLERKFVPNKVNQLEFTGKTQKCLNMGSYNYLGFTVPSGFHDKKIVETLENYSPAMCSTRNEVGRSQKLIELEKKVAEFVRKEDAICFAMGFATNSTSLPLICGKESLIISDCLNHASLVWGSRSSKATVRVFQHNNMNHLEKVIRNAIVKGQPRTGRPWKKIMIVVEGIYSMEGEIVPLPEIIALKKKYKCYLYIDEAHSIGAIGESSRGVVDYYNLNPSDVDILMGTFTKSFGSVGGYIAADKDIIDTLRLKSYSSIYADSLSPACAEQILVALDSIMDKNVGNKRVKKLKENSNYLRKSLINKGFYTIGDMDSPVIPVLIYCPSVIAEFSRKCLAKGLALVSVGFPATNLVDTRIRLCVSSAHTKSDLDHAINVMDKVGTKLMTRYKLKNKINPDKIKTPFEKFSLLENNPKISIKQN